MRFWIDRGVIAKTAIVATTVVTVGSGLASCSIFGPSDPEKVVRSFVDALDSKDATKAAALTSYPNAAAVEMKGLFDGLKDSKPDYEVSQYIEIDDSSGFFNLDTSWDLGNGHELSYSSSGQIRKLAVGWRISWDPTVLMPQLGHGRSVNLVRTDATPAPAVVDAQGQQLMSQQDIKTVKLDPDKIKDVKSSTEALAEAIEPVAPLITADSLQKQLKDAKGDVITAVGLREADFNVLESALRKIPGVVITDTPRLITVDRRIVSPVIDSLRDIWQQGQDKTKGWAVQVTSSDGEPPVRLIGEQGPPGPNIRTTIDSDIQMAAEDAVSMTGVPAAIVAIQPSTGAILAVAQNSWGAEMGDLPLNTTFPVGDIAKMFGNRDGAASLGVGANYTINGLKQVTGSLPGGKDAINGNNLKTSPFGMALAVASANRGSLVSPFLVPGQTSKLVAGVPKLSNDTVKNARSSLVEIPSKSSFWQIRQYGGTLTGMTSQKGKVQWVVGSRNDVAYAVLLTGAEGDGQIMGVANFWIKELASGGSTAR
ncbi:NTF2-like N-terminal transpeptidase domain-containing protein [Smaragdicoccus niigatensis]|uniref:NTF2-like N-terminal transpeptidase domain-containing protein n=1 Tax=Smaragdicoccus niigatensis TaxID=359359 RepID=UPI00138AB847|nr:NTF2-like N-terminal transpeptidase domain-containing protein [Smaragdicoccus niigatensis]